MPVTSQGIKSATVHAIGCSISTRGNEIFNIIIWVTKAKRGVQFWNSTHNASRIWQWRMNGSVLMRTKCLNTSSPQVPSAYPAMCRTQRESKKIFITAIRLLYALLNSIPSCYTYWIKILSKLFSIFNQMFCHFAPTNEKWAKTAELSDLSWILSFENNEKAWLFYIIFAFFSFYYSFVQPKSYNIKVL